MTAEFAAELAVRDHHIVADVHRRETGARGLPPY
jgi:hypothetical protein